MSRAVVLFGATGDLALRMLFPSLYNLEADGLLPDDLSVLACSKPELSEAAFAAQVEAAVRQRADGRFSEEAWDRLRRRLGYCAGDATGPEMYIRLAARLDGTRERIFYLSTSPSLYGPIARNLARAGLTGGRSRIVVEKPLGRDLASCRETNDALASAFSEDRIFRVDHYLGKEAVQNLLALRFANALFEPLWNKVSIDHVQITVSETVGVEGRSAYYDDYGAVRDMVQNHLLQLLCLVAMEPPSDLDPDSVRNEKVKVLRSLRPIAGRDVERKTVRGQYGRGVVEGAAVPGYAEEAGRPSGTDTFVALCAHVDNWRWAGVPFYLRTGKRLPTRSSQIVIQFRQVPHSIFPSGDLLDNRLTIRLQPEEEISLLLMNKTPSLDQAGVKLKPLALNLSLSEAFRGQTRRRIAYERLFLEALNDNPTLFVRRDEAEAAWGWIDAVVDGWAQFGPPPSPYPAGAWGPSAAFALTERNGHSWYE
ncbi:glucose-6-phosphate dehydrogenase [Caulobacter sp. 17J80-11]|uniref:glucose-6-phosphate dehydrogenase n=1 Tax=Caulobacter sp. 17J80-11 TaxID=2763502 RepID=UPI0016535CC7|nr:glucose-6-phosphate dehydrogenase [Caulobacter sp. 17J80-11]MBC6982435.1 glucose-6-phosphate dehydrogenase [Caulobacter sp. 17J80-11]